MLNVPPSRMATQVSDNLRDLNRRGFSLTWIGDRLNEAKRRLVNAVRAIQANFLKKTTTVAVVVGTEEYDLPLDMPPDGLTGVEPLYTQYGRSRFFVPYNQRNKITSGSEKHFSTYHNGRRMRIAFLPTPAEAENVTIVYQRSTIEMQYGTPVSMTASQVRLAATPTLGRRYLTDSYPVGAYAMITAGSALGDVRQITAYTALTNRITVDSPWTLVPSALSTVVEILPDWIDDDVADYCVFDTTMVGLDRDEEDSSRWRAKRDECLTNILNQVKNLQRVEPYRMTLDREANRAGMRVLPRDVRIP